MADNDNKIGLETVLDLTGIESGQVKYNRIIQDFVANSANAAKQATTSFKDYVSSWESVVGQASTWIRSVLILPFLCLLLFPMRIGKTANI